jgi:hypothetical protein
MNFAKISRVNLYFFDINLVLCQIRESTGKTKTKDDNEEKHESAAGEIQ